MTPRTQHHDYLERLLVSLRVRDVPAARIREILDEVEGHLAVSGEDPTDAFGSPAELAAAFAEASRTRRRGLSIALIAVCGFLAPILLLAGVGATFGDRSVAISLGDVGGLAVALGALAFGLRLLWDHLDGRRGRWAPVLLFTAGIAGGLALRAAVAEPVLVRVPGWLLVAAAAACVGALIAVVRGEPLPPRHDGEPLPPRRGDEPAGSS